VSCGGDEALLRMAWSVRDCLAEGGIWISMSYSSSRFNLDALPFDMDVIAKIPTPKQRPADPDIYHICYLLKPMEDSFH